MRAMAPLYSRLMEKKTALVDNNGQSEKSGVVLRWDKDGQVDLWWFLWRNIGMAVGYCERQWHNRRRHGQRCMAGTGAGRSAAAVIILLVLLAALLVLIMLLTISAACTCSNLGGWLGMMTQRRNRRQQDAQQSQ